ncbi:MAG: site-specific integrase [Magnetococcales bacterium]|nr:site-specific integrase [Magnetococcales bacterium]
MGGRANQSGVTVRGDSIQIDFRYRGVRCRETLKLKPTKANMKYAENLRRIIHHEIATGSFDYAAHFPDSKRAAMFGFARGGNETVETALKGYMAAVHRTTAVSTFRDYESAARHHLIPALGHLQLKHLTAAQVRAWISTLTISNKRINNVLVPLRGMLKDAFADGIIDKDPMARIKNLPVVRDDPDPFSPEEQAAILMDLRPQAHNLIQFAFWTGLRTGELIALEWGDIDWQRQEVVVRRSITRKTMKTPKTAAGLREVKLLGPALEALTAQKTHTFLEGGRVFHNDRTSRPWETDAQIRRTAWEHALKRAGVRYRNPYQTRHTYASMMLSAGESPMWVARQMGHRDWGLIRTRYARWIPQADEGAGSRAEALFGHNLATNKKANHGK